MVATPHGTLWAVSHGTVRGSGAAGGKETAPPAPGSEQALGAGQGEVAEFSMADGSLLRRFALPELLDAEPNAIALTPASLAFFSAAAARV